MLDCTAGPASESAICDGVWLCGKNKMQRSSKAGVRSVPFCLSGERRFLRSDRRPARSPATTSLPSRRRTSSWSRRRASRRPTPIRPVRPNARPPHRSAPSPITARRLISAPQAASDRNRTALRVPRSEAAASNQLRQRPDVSSSPTGCSLKKRDAASVRLRTFIFL